MLTTAIGCDVTAFYRRKLQKSAGALTIRVAEFAVARANRQIAGVERPLTSNQSSYSIPGVSFRRVMICY